MNENTVTSIMEALAEMSRKKEPIDAQTWMEAASKLNSLLQGEQAMLYEMEHELAKMRSAYLLEGKSSVFAKQMIEANRLWLVYKMQCALIDRAKETILLAKKNATLASELMRNGL